jgi:3-deoxy-manno-octulosonate cytidylyltransferase (CMP-KDO synthetase)
MFHVVIPARYAASRLPGKPLLPVGDKSLIERVWLRAMASGAASVLIATDDERIRAAALGFGANCMMTSAEHASGTDRIAEVVRARGFAASDVVINLQGDEPMMPADVIVKVAAAVQAPGVDIATAIAPIETLAQFLDPNCVKALRGEDGRALYFSRAPVPWPRDGAVDRSPGRFEGAWRHIGIYGYRAASLLKFAAWKPTVLESIEKLEQLRALEHGMRIQLVTLAKAPPAGVDTAADLQRVRESFAGP